MASVNAPRGLVLARKNGQGSNSTGIDTISWFGADASILPSAALGSMYVGDPLKAGTSCTVLPAPAEANDKCIGVFQGISYVNVDGEQVFRRYWESGTSGTDIKIHISRDPNQTYFIQGDASVVAVSGVGNPKPTNVPWIVGTGSKITGNSGYVFDSSGAADAQRNLRVIRRAPWDTDTCTSAGVTDQYPWYEVILNNHYDRFQTTSVSTG
jgi:hypothetical protein|tara:strand:- start:857 stop:1489 length:633 start_codon:yes stop_codon:yes gene_type:complete